MDVNEYEHKSHMVLNDHDIIPESVYRIYIVDMPYGNSGDDECEVFRGRLCNIKFPNNVHTLQFGNYCRKNVVMTVFDFADIHNVKFPDKLHTLIFPDRFNQKIDDINFPADLHIVRFGWLFNQPIDNIKFPKNVHVLDLFGCKDISNINIPLTVKTVVISKKQKGLLKLPYGCCEVVA